MKKSLHITLQIIYWIFFLFLILLIVSASWAGQSPKTIGNVFSHIFFSFITILFIVPSVIGFYTSYFVVFSALLRKESLAKVLLYGFSFSVVLSFIMWLIKLQGVFTGIGSVEFVCAVLLIALMIFVNGTIALMIRGFVKWLNDIKLTEELNKKNYDTEIELLRSKINPHFLFNTINNIDVLINTDPVKASQYLNELSDIMRFMLYETSGDRIPLARELDYIEKYIGLQRIRSSNAAYVIYHTSVDGNDLHIAPMLFIPFIENAFKHAESKKSEQAIVISIAVNGNTVTFECSNRYSVLPHELSAGGLGNELMRKRLQLLYPGKHSLDITHRDGRYTVKLILTADGH